MKITNFINSKNKYYIFLAVGIICVILCALPQGKGVSTVSLEKKLKTTLEMAEGVGDVNVMLTFDENNRVEGAIIVAEGAKTPIIKKSLHNSAVAVLNVPNNKVQVLVKKK